MLTDRLSVASGEPSTSRALKRALYVSCIDSARYFGHSALLRLAYSATQTHPRAAPQGRGRER